MANMLPPFVPPSARVPSESLPLITEFVVERGAHAPLSESAVATAPRAWTSEDEGPLPSIDDFLLSASERSDALAQPDHPVATAAPEPDQAPEQGSERETQDEQADDYEHRPVVGISEDQIPAAPTEIVIPPQGHVASEVKESTPPGAVFNDEAGDAEAEAPGFTRSEAWEASSVSPAAVPDALSGQDDAWESSEPAAPTAPSAGDAAWVSEERDSYDWQSVGALATGPDETRRAEDAWSGTDWEPRRKPENEQVAAALLQLARRVRAGDVKVDIPANASVEASLAALLAALLTEGGE